MRKENELNPKDSKGTLVRLFSYFKFNKSLFFSGIIFIIIGTIAEIGTNAMLSPIIDTLVEDYDKGLLIKYILIMMGFVVLVSIGQYIGNFSMAKLAQKTIHKIREELFTHMAKLPMSYFDRKSHGELMSSFTNDVDMLSQSLEQSVSQIIISLITVIGTFAMMLYISWILTIIVVVVLVIIVFVTKFIGGRSAKFYRAQQSGLGDMNGYVEEIMSGQKVVKVFNYEERAIKEFDEKNENLRVVSTNAATYGVILFPIMGNLAYLLYGLVAMLGAYFIINGKMSVGNIAAFLQFTRTITRPITQVSNQLNTLFAALAGGERIFDILDEAPEIDEGDVYMVEDSSEKNNLFWRVPMEGNKYEDIPVQGHVSFDQVDFGYVPGQKVLKNINLYAKPGHKIAFVGSTGAGKSTITNLINRFYEVNEGTIFYDGIDIRRIKKFDLRGTMSVVLQDINLFEATVAENIRYGRLDATDEEVKAAAKLANAHYFIKHLPQGYDTMLSVDGGNLSQGERQLLSIARAAVANPTILILDEATSSVDTRTEKLIAEGMDKLMENRTTFVIAHRLSTVRDSNAIMVLEQGEIIERGNHDSLIDQQGRYYALNTGAIELE